MLGLLALSCAGKGMTPAMFGVLVIVQSYAKSISDFIKFQTWQLVVQYGTPALTNNNPQQFRNVVSFSFSLDIVSGAVAIVAVVVGAFFVWNAFFRYDDAADIQGEWRTQENAMTVVIDVSNIRMPDLEYSYEIDTASKRLTFHFSELTGSGTYSFSSDRSTLTIVEGEGDAATTTVFTKVSDNAQATPQLIDPAESDDATADGEGASENAEESGDAAASEEAADEGGEGSGEESGDAAASDDAGDSDGASGGADASNGEAQA